MYLGMIVLINLNNNSTYYRKKKVKTIIKNYDELEFKKRKIKNIK